MAFLSTPLDTLLGLQQALDAYRTSGWLDTGPSGSGAYPPINVFRRGEDVAIIAELPGVKKSEVEVEVKGRTIRISGQKSVDYPGRRSVHRRERLSGRFDRAITVPIEIDPNAVQAEYRDGILALLLRRAEREKPRKVEVT
jgi:HSP20 family protein